jgi:hypothetical protein
MCGAVIGGEGEGMGSKPDVGTYSKQVKNKSYGQWPVLSPGYIKHNFSYFY